MYFAAGLSGEDLALVIDHAQRGVVAHAAAAQGMDRDQLVALRFGPQRVGNEVALDRVVGLAQQPVVARDHPGAARARPIDAQTFLVVEPQCARGGVHAHHQVGLRACGGSGVRHLHHFSGCVHDRLAGLLRLEKPRGRSLSPILQEIAEQGVSHESPWRNHAGNRAWDHALFDHQAILDPRRIAHIDHASDAGAGPLLRGQRVAAAADAVDALEAGCLGRTVARLLPVIVVAEAEHVAVAGEAVPKPGR